MSFTGTQVIDHLDALYRDTADGKWTDAQKLAALNYAIDCAWPHIRDVDVDASQTIAATTYEYTPSATPEIEYGFALAYASLDSGPRVLLRRVKQRQDGTAFTILLDDETASAYAGETLYLQYCKRVARITAASDTIELPMDYLVKAARVFLLENKMVQEATANTDVYEKLLVKAERDLATALPRHARGQIAHRIPPVAEFGGGSERQLTSGLHA